MGEELAREDQEEDSEHTPLPLAEQEEELALEDSGSKCEIFYNTSKSINPYMNAYYLMKEIILKQRDFGTFRKLWWLGRYFCSSLAKQRWYQQVGQLSKCS